MADWNGSARTNFVRIKDKQGLIASLEPFGDIHLGWHPKFPDSVVCFDGSRSEFGGFPSTVWDEEDNEVEFSWAEHVAPFLAEGEVLVFMESGSEKLRYISGHAGAITWDGREVVIYLGDIYRMAAEKFGVDVNCITRAEYMYTPKGLV